MAPFSLCAGLGATDSTALKRAAQNWDDLKLEQILVGETNLLPHPQRKIRAEVSCTGRDEPALIELLRLAAQLASEEWLLLVPADALLTPSLVENLRQLCRPGSQRRLVIGRAWLLPEAEISPGDQLEQRQNRYGLLDPPGSVSWLLLPRGALLAAPAELSCRPADAAGWLTNTAQQLGWPVLDATAAAPLLRPATRSAIQPQTLTARSQASGVVLPHRPGAPLLSLLLAAPQAQLNSLAAALRPCSSLPWEVVARPAETAGPTGELAAAWNSGLEACQAAIAWPISANLPPLALLPVLLRCFELPAVELVQLGLWPRPGGLVIQSAWLRRLGGLSEHGSAAQALDALKQKAQKRGANCLQLPLTSCTPSAATFATTP